MVTEWECNARYGEYVKQHEEKLLRECPNRIPIVINAYGGPGSGKSVSCMDIYQQLKKRGFNAEYVQEYAKDLIYDENWEMLDGSAKHQFMVLQEQVTRMDCLYGYTDFIVTDSPSKHINANLQSLLKSKQLARESPLNPNIGEVSPTLAP